MEPASNLRELAIKGTEEPGRQREAPEVVGRDLEFGNLFWFGRAEERLSC